MIDANITFHHSGSTYDVYWYAWYATLAYTCILHGTNQTMLSRNTDVGYFSMYVKLTEGDTFEFHGVDETGADYFKSVYTATGGDITAVEHGVTTTIAAL